jgi:hypothetical protein
MIVYFIRNVVSPGRLWFCRCANISAAVLDGDQEKGPTNYKFLNPDGEVMGVLQPLSPAAQLVPEHD